MPRRRSLPQKARRGVLPALLFAFLAGPTPTLAQDPPPPIDPTPIELLITITGNSGAFARGVFSSSIRDNVVNLTEHVAETRLVDSVLGNRGIVQINQDAGLASNQMNIVLIAAAAGAAEPVADASFHAQIEITGNTIVTGAVTRSNVIENVLNGSVGIAQINQNSGTLNVNLNALVIGLGLGTGNAAVSMSDSSLSGVASNLQYTGNGPVSQTNTISGVTNFTGIAQISQVVGDANVAANLLTISVTVLNIQ